MILQIPDNLDDIDLEELGYLQSQLTELLQLLTDNLMERQYRERTLPTTRELRP